MTSFVFFITYLATFVHIAPSRASNCDDEQKVTLPTVTDIAANPTTLLEVCQGDCESDADCNGDLRCFHNVQDSANTPPGCTGSATTNWDYCFDLPAVVDVEVDPTSPLGLCRGDCDTDEDCKGELRCFHNVDGAADLPPGCKGTATANWDYCFKTPELMSLFGNPPDGTVLNMCEGDCDSDEECQGDLMCFHNIDDHSDVPPGCTGTANLNWDYCFQYPELQNIEVNPTHELGHCEGDCDSDGDCAGDMTCFHNVNDAADVPPGCSGTASANWDYCYETPTLRVVGVNPANPLSICEGDCDSDAGCEGDLMCFHNADGSADVPPGCDGVAKANWDYCFQYPVLKNIDVNPTVLLEDCQGDCDSDSECSGDLKCFHNVDGATDVPPQCSGTASADWDYCYDTPSLRNVGGNPITPLFICEGDCDKDEDCNGDLMCFHNVDDATDVPEGCVGTASANWDYCFQYPTLKNVEVDPAFQLEHCQGDCDSDNDCLDDMTCFHNVGGTSNVPPGCHGTASVDWDYCYRTPVLRDVGGNPANPLSICEGDCDSDAGCKDGLMCFHNINDAANVPPGCDGTARMNWDYCFQYPALSKIDVNPTELLGQCEGDCDSNDECVGDLTCFHNINGDANVPPGCSGTATSNWDYCYETPTLHDVAGNPIDPLNECQGDCDNDDDCAGELKCFHNTGGASDVPPGCQGNAQANWDYCYQGDGTTNANVGPFAMDQVSHDTGSAVFEIPVYSVGRFVMSLVALTLLSLLTIYTVFRVTSEWVSNCRRTRKTYSKVLVGMTTDDDTQL